ncbi:MAG: GNAT family N-acetyltransferase [Gemmatimonadetes bacterium]|nr:GNAT family N-acetyltransferase [Gemmatimonadota bacterium]
MRGDPRTLRLNLEILDRDPAARARIAAVLAERGFTRSDPPNVYVDTLVMDLTPDEDALFSALHRSARRNVREAEKQGLELRPISDPALADRLDALLEETMARTGGRYVPQDWAGRMKLAAERPELARLVGLFIKDATGPESLLAFAFGCAHGDHGQYSDAASTRATDVRVSLAYPLLWDIILWAKRGGMSWFDLGGVTRGNLGDEADPLGGISDFKRFFTRELATVGEDWVLESSSIRARLARAVHRRLQKA